MPIGNLRRIPGYMKDAVKEMPSKFSKFDRFIAILLFAVIPVLLVIIRLSGLYCIQGGTYADVIKDCPAIDFSYTGKPFWSYTAITSNFIHDKSFQHVLDNLVSNYLFLTLAYASIAVYSKRKLVNNIFPLSLGLLLTFVSSIIVVPFIGMIYFSKTNLFGLPTYGFSGVTSSFLGFWCYITLMLLSRMEIKSERKRVVLLLLLPVLLLLFSANFAYQIISGIGNRFVHFVGFLTGFVTGSTTYIVYTFEEKLKLKIPKWMLPKSGTP